VDRQLTLEVHEEVLAVRVDARDGAAGELLGPALAAQARVGVRDLRDQPGDERPDPTCRVVDRVALRHGFVQSSVVSQKFARI
jgi:hypothetical protein